MRTSKTPYLFKIKQSLGPLEYKIVEIIWEKEKTTVREVLEILKNDSQIAYTTAMTVMDNLYKKGFLKREKVKNYYRYSPIVQKKSLIDSSITNILQTLFGQYGRGKIYALFFLSNIPHLYFSSFQLFAFYSFFSTIIFGFFIYSFLDLMANFNFFGVTEYLKLFLFDINLVTKNLHLLLPALIESLPLINLISNIFLGILSLLMLKKIFKFYKFSL